MGPFFIKGYNKVGLASAAMLVQYIHCNYNFWYSLYSQWYQAPVVRAVSYLLQGQVLSLNLNWVVYKTGGGVKVLIVINWKNF